MNKIIGKIGAFVYCSAIVTASVLFTIRDADKNLRKEVTIEAGSSINIEDFFVELPDDAVFVTDVSTIDTKVPAIYKLKVFYDEAFEKEVILKIEDHTAPKGSAVPQSYYCSWKPPEAENCVNYLYDLSGIAKIEYLNGTPVFTEGGEYEVPVSVTDVYGNSTVIQVPFSVIDDHTAPVIKGIPDIEIGDDPHDLNLFKGVTVTDDYDPEPVLKVDDSRVNYRKSGIYEIIYSAVDKAGNIGNVKRKIKVTIPEIPEEETQVEKVDWESQYNYYTSNAQDAYAIAANIVSGLMRDSDVETARAIFNWVHANIYYQTVNYYQTYEAAALRGLSNRSGDCYVFFSCAKMLLDQAGIPNMMVTRYPVVSNGHYWNLVKLNGLWYHCDATPFHDHPGVFFMCTDDEIDDYHHQYDGTLYPERAGGSRLFKPSPTPTKKITPTPRPTATPKPTATSTPKPTATPAPTATQKPTATPSPTATSKPTNTPKPSPTTEPLATPKPTATATPTAEPTASPSATPTPTDIPVITAEPTVEPTSAPTDTPEPTQTEDPVPTPSDVPEPAGETIPTPASESGKDPV